MYVGGLEVEEAEEGRVVHGGRGQKKKMFAPAEFVG